MILILFILSILSCKDTPLREAKELKTLNLVAQLMDEQHPSNNFPYDLSAPFVELKLENKLKEISGVTYNPNTDQIIAINDEKGNLYLIDLQTGLVTSKIDFGYGGDYEGVEYVNGMVYVAKSDGNIYQWDLQNEQAGKSLKTRLTYSNNVEGLGYDPATNSLLLACKDEATLSGQDKVKGKAVYSFSLSKNKMDAKPIISLRDKTVSEWYAKERVDPETDKKLKNRLHSFSPSGIAVHPVTAHYYILSAKGHTLIVVNRQGEIIHVALLSKSLEQPEGLCFDPQGNLYISSEGVQNVARIFGYKIVQ